MSAIPIPNPCHIVTPNNTSPIIMAKTVILLAIDCISSCRGDFDFFSSCVRPAILPSSVFIPVAAMTPFALPVATVVPRNAILSRSARDDFFFIVLLFFSWGIDSPVSEKSLVLRSNDSIMRTSAGTLSPSSRYKISPGTSSNCGSSVNSPSLYTLAGDCTSFFRESMIRSALCS